MESAYNPFTLRTGHHMELTTTPSSENRSLPAKIAESAWDEPGEAGFPNSKDQDWDLCKWLMVEVYKDLQKKPTKGSKRRKMRQKLSKIESFRWNLSLTPSHRELWNTNWTLEALPYPWGKRKGFLETPTHPTPIVSLHSLLLQSKGGRYDFKASLGEAALPIWEQSSG